ncbi:MAG: nitrous oxide reductase accessory protein NosL [Myxococcaceae bacterium]
MKRPWLFLGATLLAACAKGPVPPAPLDTRNEVCAYCRMMVSDARFASQLVAPAEEPRFFDDLGCLRDYLAANPKRPAGSIAYVADHRTRAWVAAERAVYSRNPALQTPMSSHLIAHADEGSRDQDPDAKGAEAVGAGEVLGAGTAARPEGERR